MSVLDRDGVWCLLALCGERVVTWGALKKYVRCTTFAGRRFRDAGTCDGGGKEMERSLFETIKEGVSSRCGCAPLLCWRDDPSWLGSNGSCQSTAYYL